MTSPFREDDEFQDCRHQERYGVDLEDRFEALYEENCDIDTDLEHDEVDVESEQVNCIRCGDSGCRSCLMLE